MKTPIKVALILTLSFGFSVHALAQSTGQTIQQSGNCSVNNAGTDNTATIVCTGVDATLAEQIRTILRSAKRSENAEKDIKEMLTRVIAQMSGVSYGNLKTRCIALSQDIEDYTKQRYYMLNKVYPPSTRTREQVEQWYWTTDVAFRMWYLDRVKSIRNELAGMHIVDTELDKILSEDQQEEPVRQAQPHSSVSGRMDIITIRRVGERLAVLANQVPQ